MSAYFVGSGVGLVVGSEDGLPYRNRLNVWEVFDCCEGLYQFPIDRITHKKRKELFTCWSCHKCPSRSEAFFAPCLLALTEQKKIVYKFIVFLLISIIIRIAKKALV